MLNPYRLEPEWIYLVKVIISSKSVSLSLSEMPTLLYLVVCYYSKRC